MGQVHRRIIHDSSMAGRTLIQQLLRPLTILVLVTVHQGHAVCDVAAVETCLDTIYTSSTPCTQQSLAALDACFETHLGTCMVADVGTLRQNLTLVHGRCSDTCTTPPTPADPCGPRGTCTRDGDTWGYKCMCEAEWTGPRCDDDVDECADSSLNDCGAHATCRNKRGSFSCICDNGLVFKSATRTCEVYNGCAFNALKCQHKCTSVGAGACECHPGFTLQGNGVCSGAGSCSETNRQACIADNSHGCYRSALGADTCFCKLGYNGAQGRFCNVQNACLGSPCQTTCQSTNGLFDCGCASGSEIQEDRRTCIECDDNHYGEQCISVCNCGANYARCGPTGCTDCKAGWTGTGCQLSIDLAPCDANTDCGQQGTCVNLAGGGYECQCNQGHVNQNGHPKGPCEAFNECEKAYGNDCEMTCMDTDTGYTCGCDPGYELAEDGLSCSNIDDCGDDDGCEFQCVDGVMSFTCECDEGFQLNEDQETCSQIDDCETNSCEQVCEDGTLYYSCTCYPGYQLHTDNITCTDVDDCVGHDCADMCEDGNSTYTCSCDVGYELNADNKNCDDIDECMENTDGCDQQCTNKVGSFTCSCQSGYTLNTDLKMCTEINPCDNDDCEQMCVRDSATEFHCTCNTGYVVSTTDPKACTDVDECADGDDECEQGCVDTDGGYTCSCDTGFVLKSDQRTCRAQSACETNTDDCEEGCQEDNTVAGFTCTCSTGFTLGADGKACDDVDECSANTDDCQQVCQDTEGSYTCACNAGYTLNADGKTCEDIDECTAGTHDCEHGCVDTDGAFTCTCPAGSVLNQNGKTCQVSNFCAENDCDHRCTNGQCVCDDGYTLNNDDINCDDTDECEGAHVCEGGCTNMPGTYQCTCSGDMVLHTDRKTCVEGCDLVCGDDATCNNVAGQATCVCDLVGFSHNAIDNVCRDVDECSESLLNECTVRAVCVNMAGSYRCDCPPGYNHPSTQQRDCIDIDECLDADYCVDSTRCINRIGSYHCPCDSFAHDNTSFILHVNMAGDVDDAVVVLVALKSLLVTNDEVMNLLDDDFNLYSCKFTAPAGQSATRRLLQSGGELSFALVADEYLTDEQRAAIILSIMQQLRSPTDLTVGQDVITMSDPAVVSNGRTVNVADQCAYLDLIDHCRPGSVCSLVNGSTPTCVLLPKPPGLTRKTIIALTTSAGLAGFIFLLLVAFGVFICKKQKENNAYNRNRGKRLLPRGFDGVSQSQSNPASLHIDKRVVQDPGIRMQYQFYKDSVSRPTYTPAIHSGTMRGWSGQGSQGWAPSVGRLEAPNQTPIKDDSLKDVGLAQFDEEEDGNYNALTNDQGASDAIFQAI